MSCGPFAKRCQHRSLESENCFQTYKICLLSSAMFTRTLGVKGPSRHAFRSRSAGQDKTYEACFVLFYSNIIMTNKKKSIETQICDPGCVDFTSNRHNLQCLNFWDEGPCRCKETCMLHRTVNLIVNLPALHF